MKRDAFDISFPDLVRKLSSRYTDPTDYVHNVVSEAYEPGASVDIVTEDDSLTVTHSKSLDDLLFDDAAQQGLNAVMVLMPPTDNYAEIDIASGNRTIHVDADRNISVGTSKEFVDGTQMVIHREQIEGETDRLRELYSGSDLNVQLNGEDLSTDNFTFEQGDFRGDIAYNAQSSGAIKVYEQGRFVATLPFISGVDIALHEHDLPTTLTKSRVIVDGKGKEQFEEWQSVVPDVVKAYIDSDEAKALPPRSYQTLLRSVQDSFGDNEEIAQIIKEQIQFQSNQGLLSLDQIAHSSADLSKNDRVLYERLTGQKAPAYVEEKKRSRIPRWAVGAGLAAVLMGGVVAGANNAVTSSVDESTNEIRAGSMQFPLDDSAVIETIDTGFAPSYGGISSGGGYMPTQGLAGLVASQPVGIPGYVRMDTSNFVHGKDLWLWTDKAPEERLQSSVEFELPKELEHLRGQPQHDIIQAVAAHMGTFEYGSIPPEMSTEYDGLAEAMDAERLAYCSVGNTYAALILEELGVTNVRYAVGTVNGGGHAWLEIQKDGEWQIADFTPPRLDDEFRNVLDETNVDQRGPYELNGERVTAKYDLGNWRGEPISSARQVTREGGIQFSMDPRDYISTNPEDYLKPGTPMDYILAAGLGAAGLAAFLGGRRVLRGVSGEDVYLADFPMPQHNESQRRQIEDLTGFDVSIGSDYSKTFDSEGYPILTVPAEALDDPLAAVGNLLNYLDERTQLEIIDNVAQVAR